MLSTCFNVYTHDMEPTEAASDSSEEAEWDEATRIARNAARGSVPEDSTNSRALCDGCRKPLCHIARLPRFSAFLRCGSEGDCDRCESPILAGEMYFTCINCGTHVCKDCGPGVCIARRYDFYNSFTGEGNIQAVPARVMHERRARSKLEKRNRSINLTTLHCEELARGVLACVEHLCQEVAAQDECLDQDWEDEDLLPRLLGVDKWTDVPPCLLQLAATAREQLTSEAVLGEVMGLPCKIFGDLHGQFRDLLLFFHAFGMPGSEACPYVVFNGDFVDRGKHQLEVMTVLFAFKILYPRQIFLNRGNHEDHHMNAKYGFLRACEVLGQYSGPMVYKAFNDTFQVLPLATLIAGKILTLHGGIGDGTWSIRDLNTVRRPLSHDDFQKPQNKWLWNILWSDPIEDDQSNQRVFGVHSSPRSKLAVKFGWNITQAFCARNGLDLIVRSHQSKKGGLGFDVMHHESLIRVFSARDYERNANDGAILLVDQLDSGDTQDGSDMLSVRAQVLGALSKE